MLKYASPNGKYIPIGILENLALFSECDLKVYLRLLLQTNLPGQKLTFSLDSLAETLGFTRRSLRRSLAKWKGFGLLAIETLKTKSHQVEIQLLISMSSLDGHAHSKSTSSGTLESKVQEGHPVNVQPSNTKSPPVSQNRPRSVTLETNVQAVASKEYNTAVININSPGKERESEGEKNPQGGHSTPKDLPFEAKTKNDLLALDIARSFHDEAHLPMYRHFCVSMDESVIRRAFSEAMQTPEENIKRSRPALFIYLLRKYAYPTKDQNPRP